MRIITAAAIAAALLAGGVTPVAAADIPANCVQQFWMVGLRAAQRTICDGPMAGDGSWERGRGFYAPAFVADGISVCYSSSYCTFSLPRTVPVLDTREYYRVTPATVLSDEPGYIGLSANGAVA